MYVPRHFELADDDLRDLLLRAGAGDLVTSGRSGLQATLVPFVYDPDDGPHGTLRGHLARNNPQWQDDPVGEALVIVRGPDGYVSPSWYASKAEHGRVVPTWDYVSAHVHGDLEVVDDPAFVREVVEDLTAKHEAGRVEPWSVGDAPAPYVAGQLRAVVGVRLVITRVEAKAKLSQNRSDADVDGVRDGLRREGQVRLADEVQARRPQR